MHDGSRGRGDVQVRGHYTRCGLEAQSTRGLLFRQHCRPGWISRRAGEGRSDRRDDLGTVLPGGGGTGTKPRRPRALGRRRWRGCSRRLRWSSTALGMALAASFGDRPGRGAWASHARMSGLDAAKPTFEARVRTRRSSADPPAGRRAPRPPARPLLRPRHLPLAARLPVLPQ